MELSILMDKAKFCRQQELNRAMLNEWGRSQLEDESPKSMCKVKAELLESQEGPILGQISNQSRMYYGGDLSQSWG
jgi:hypothetical protein